MRRRRGIMGLNVGAVVPIITATATGNPLSFITDMVRPLKSLEIPFTPIQSGSGDPSPDNVRPISGWTGCEINGAGKNLLDPNTFSTTRSGAYTSYWSVIHRPENAILVWTFEDNDTSVELPSDCSMLLRTRIGDNSSAYKYLMRNGQLLSDANGYESAQFPVVAWSKYNQTALDYIAKIFQRYKIMCRVKGTDATYLPFFGTTIPINWQSEAGTVYGGTLTLNEDGSADLVSEYGFLSLNGTENWAWSVTAQTGAINANLNIPAMKSLGNSPLGKASYAKNNSGDSGTLCIRFGWNNRQIYLFNPQNYLDGVTDLTSFKAYLAEHPLQISFPLATSSTYHFDSIGQLITFVGTNNIWTDTNGTNTATYLKHQS